MTGFRDGGGISWTICKQSAPHSRQTTTPTPNHLIFTGRMLFLTPFQQHQSTEGTDISDTPRTKIKLDKKLIILVNQNYFFWNQTALAAKEM